MYFGIMNLYQLEDHIYITKDDGSSEVYFHVWLYDNKPGNRHSNGQKITDTLSLNLDIHPEDVELDNGNLRVTWENETIDYPLDFLRNLKEKPLKLPRFYWDASLEFTKHPYEHLDREFEYNQFILDVIKYGFAIIQGMPCQDGEVLNLVKKVGYLRETNYGLYYDVLTKPNPNNLANSDRALAPHTDNPYRYRPPALQIIHALEADAQGGHSILVDGFKVANSIRNSYPEYYALLCQHNIVFEYKTENEWLLNKVPIIQLDCEENLQAVHFNKRSIQPFNLPFLTIPIIIKLINILNSELIKSLFSLNLY